MNISRISKTVLTVTTALAIMSGHLSAKDTEYARTQKELKIMSKIFETSLSEADSSRNKIFGSKKTDAMYLAKQGMVFTFNFGRNTFNSVDNWEQFGEGIGHFVEAIATEVGSALSDFPEVSPPEKPEPPEAPEFHFNEAEQFEAYQERMEALEKMREKQLEQREEVRELQRQIRSLERESSRREHSESKSESKELEKTRIKLEEKMNVLNKKMEDYKKSMREYRETRDKKFTESAKRKSDIIISTLCDYGSTLRSLNNNEYVTIIFKNSAKNQDKVYVFEYSDIKNCDSKDKLLESAVSYKI
ncbi:hypothetical protein [Aliikangiella sp. IMCC44359]|uniref:hypothetical protein n=1 Tax=Aliikangiella sp. IMCC44359 TaxID=3459125 RepID=UPI00403AF9C4